MPHTASVCLVFLCLAIWGGAVRGVSVAIQQCIVILVSRFTIFCTFSRSTAHCTVHLCTHIEPFLCILFLSVSLSLYTFHSVKTSTYTTIISNSRVNVSFSAVAVIHNSFNAVGLVFQFTDSPYSHLYTGYMVKVWFKFRPKKDWVRVH